MPELARPSSARRSDRPALACRPVERGGREARSGSEVPLPMTWTRRIPARAPGRPAIARADASASATVARIATALADLGRDDALDHGVGCAPVRRGPGAPGSSTRCDDGPGRRASPAARARRRRRGRRRVVGDERRRPRRSPNTNAGATWSNFVRVGEDHARPSALRRSARSVRISGIESFMRPCSGSIAPIPMNSASARSSRSASSARCPSIECIRGGRRRRGR